MSTRHTPSIPDDFAVPHASELARTRSVLFVCLGNICRSPTAQGVLAHLARERGVLDRLRIESCGTGSWHIGELPDPRTRSLALRHGVSLTSRARVVHPPTDFAPTSEPDTHAGFQLIVAMDRRNRRDLLALGCPAPRLVLFRAFDPILISDEKGTTERGNPDVPDPYDDEPDGPKFHEVFAIVHRTAGAMLDRLFPETMRATR